MTDSTDDVDWYDGPEFDYECPHCVKLRQQLAEARLLYQNEVDNHHATQEQLAEAKKRLLFDASYLSDLHYDAQEEGEVDAVQEYANRTLRGEEGEKR
jgi:predicted DsbA family dithiol-disulfide isomerase